MIAIETAPTGARPRARTTGLAGPLFKPDRLRRIDRLIDYFGDGGPRPRGGEAAPARAGAPAERLRLEGDRP